jgi:hypothetical protein
MGEIGSEPGSVPTFTTKDVGLGSGLVMGLSPEDVYDVVVPGVGETVICKLLFALDGSKQVLKREMKISGKLKKLSLGPEIGSRVQR